MALPLPGAGSLSHLIVFYQQCRRLNKQFKQGTWRGPIRSYSVELFLQKAPRVEPWPGPWQRSTCHVLCGSRLFGQMQKRFLS